MKTTRSVICSLALAHLAILPAQVLANVVTFDELAPGTSGPFTSSGFDFVLDGLASQVHYLQGCFPYCPLNGTHSVRAPFGPASLTMTRSGGGKFDLIGFDGSGSFNFNLGYGGPLNPGYGGPANIPNQIDVLGQIDAGGTVSQVFLIDKSSNQDRTLNFSSYLFDSFFTDLLSVTFTSSGSARAEYNGFSIDNIAALLVPEPGSLALVSMGLVGLGYSRRRTHQFGARQNDPHAAGYWNYCDSPTVSLEKLNF